MPNHSFNLHSRRRKRAVRPTQGIALLLLAAQASCATAGRTAGPSPDQTPSATASIAAAEAEPQPVADSAFSGSPAAPVTLALTRPDTPQQEQTQPADPPANRGTNTPDPTVQQPPSPAWQAERALIIDRLVMAMRRLYDSAPAEQSGVLLVSMLSDEIPELRTLGLTLVDEELADAQPVPSDVGLALSRLLASPDPRVRTASARLLNRLAQPGLENAIVDALANESDASVAAELLAAASRQPSKRLVAPTLRWIATESAARESASQAGLALDRADLLTAEDRAEAAEKLRTRVITSLSAPGIRLFSRVGTEEDRRSLLPLLRSSEPAIRLATAESLSRYAPYVDALVEAASNDPSLVDVAVRSIAAHRASIEGLLLLRSLAFPTPEARLAAAAQITAGMDLGTLIIAADENSRTPPFVDALLGSFADAPMSADPELAVLHARALIRLAESQLNQSRPARALSLADRVTPFEPSLPESDKERLVRLRTIALIWLDRIDDPALVGSTCDHWLDALELLGSQAQGPDISEVFVDRFGATLTPEQRHRYVGLEARLLTGPRPLTPPPASEPAPARANIPVGTPADGPR